VHRRVEDDGQVVDDVRAVRVLFPDLRRDPLADVVEPRDDAVLDA